MISDLPKVTSLGNDRVGMPAKMDGFKACDFNPIPICLLTTSSFQKYELLKHSV